LDLVLVSKRHADGGSPVFNVEVKHMIRPTLNRARRILEREGIATNTLVIAGAKVPIIKFVDKQSRIKVDISLENLTGVTAHETFKQWKSNTPDLEPMVAIIKQFLLMRGLNEVQYGGLGGFSIICLVYTFLYANPPPLENGVRRANFGKWLLGFLDYWGNIFDLETQRLVLVPEPHVVTKVRTSPCSAYRHLRGDHSLNTNWL
jgi:non-canonical poly(A) RNA polymerase PAPD5/7